MHSEGVRREAAGGRASLPRGFYNRPTLDVARDLLGKVLVHRTREGTTSGAIVEVEAYIGEDDPACHAAPGPTRRNEPLYGEPGHAYVYLNYGVHFLFNVVTERRGSPAAVLVRALEPLDGMALMRRRRGAAPFDLAQGAPSQVEGPDRLPETALCRGPGNVSKAMGITLEDNRTDLCGETLYVEDRGIVPAHIAWSPRIGIRVGTEHLWRAHVAGSRAVSGMRAARQG
ncbi:MAG: DNA-3-methyladenine glycosylase [Bacteroidales bacterium]